MPAHAERGALSLTAAQQKGSLATRIIQKMIVGRFKLRIALVFVLFVFVAIAVPSIRHSILRAAGWALVVDEPAEKADIIVVSGESGSAGVLEASDLVRNGVAARVVVFTYARDAVEEEFKRRGVAFPDHTARFVGELRSLGVADVEQIPTYIRGSEDEGPVLARWCDEQRIRSVVVVGGRDHSRRLRRIFHRSLKSQKMTVIVVSSRYSQFDPDRWWNSHGSIRTEIMESEKLLLDIVRHPLS